MILFTPITTTDNFTIVVIIAVMIKIWILAALIMNLNE